MYAGMYVVMHVRMDAYKESKEHSVRFAGDAVFEQHFRECLREVRYGKACNYVITFSLHNSILISVR